MNIEKMDILEEGWKPMDHDMGHYFSIGEKFIAGTEENNLMLWKDLKLAEKIDASSPLTGFPQINGSRIYCGSGYYDLKLKRYYHIKIPDWILNPNGIMYEGHERYYPVFHAWSPDGNRLLISMKWTGRPGFPRSRIIQYERSTTECRIVCERNDNPPKAALISGNWIITGTNPPGIYDLKGNSIRELDGEFIPERIEISSDESVLMIQDFSEVRIVDIDTWVTRKRISGAWLDASLAPSGDIIGLIDFDGRIFLSYVHDQTIRQISDPDPAVSMRLGNEILVASFGKGHPIRKNQFRIKM